MANQSFVINKSLSFAVLAVAPTSPDLWEIYYDLTQGILLQWNGTSWVPFGNALQTTSYWQGYHTPASSWSTTSTTFVDPTPSGTTVLTQRQANGLSVTTAAGNLPGITFTPSSSNDVYQITATFGITNTTAGQDTSARLTDGTTVIAVTAGFGQQSVTPDVQSTFTLMGIYVPGTTSPVTVKLQVAVTSGTGSIENFYPVTGGVAIEWTVTQIAGGVLPTGPLTYWQGYHDYNYSWTTASSTTVDFTNSTIGIFASRQSSGLSVTTAASNLPGITFTPSSANAVYLIIANTFLWSNAGSDVATAILTDGTSIIATGSHRDASGSTLGPITLSGIYIPGTTSPVTIKIQGNDTGGHSGTAELSNNASSAGSNVIEWTVIQISPPPPLIQTAPPTSQYAQAYTTNAASWSTSSSSYADPTVSGTPAIAVRRSSGITLTQAGSNYPGITFTPANASAVYQITASVTLVGNSTGIVTGSRLTDGTTIIVQGADYLDNVANSSSGTVSMTGIYAPGTSSPVTVRVQMSSNGTSTLEGLVNGNPIEWTVLRIA